MPAHIPEAHISVGSGIQAWAASHLETSAMPAVQLGPAQVSPVFAKTQSPLPLQP